MSSLTPAAIESDDFRKVDPKRALIEENAGKSAKMSNLEAYLTLLKSYCAINVLLTPKAFRNGGYLLSPCALAFSAAF